MYCICTLIVTTGDEQRRTVTAIITLWQKIGEQLWSSHSPIRSHRLHWNRLLPSQWNQSQRRFNQSDATL